MNIAFVTTFRVSPEKGGTERTTLRVSDALRKIGYMCYNLYDKDIDSSLPKAVFDGTYNINKIDVKSFVEENAIDFILFEGAFKQIKQVDTALRNNRKCKLVFVHHFEPGSELYFELFHDIWVYFCSATSFKKKMIYLIKLVLYPIYKKYRDNQARRNYKVAYEKCDRIVLLSPTYINKFCDFGSVKRSDKFVSIPNAVTFDEYLSEKEILKKRKQVLVVSRLEETQKRISLVIKIWHKIEEMPELEGWSLKIVGFGDYETRYKKLAKQFNLKRIAFEGRQDPRQYYRESALFMMTSLYEGWPMTINESMQYGCVPFAFDVIPSLHDFILSGKNGFLIMEKDLDEYALQLKKVMLDDFYRHNVMENCLKTARSYSIENIINSWIKLLNTN